MKKLSLMLFVITSLAFAGSEDVLEDRIESNLRSNLSKEINYDVEYDVEIFQDKMNIELEIDGLKEPKINCDKIARKILSEVKNNAPEVKDVNITIVYDEPMGEDKILFNKRFM